MGSIPVISNLAYGANSKLRPSPNVSTQYDNGIPVQVNSSCHQNMTSDHEKSCVYENIIS